MQATLRIANLRSGERVSDAVVEFATTTSLVSYSAAEILERSTTQKVTTDDRGCADVVVAAMVDPSTVGSGLLGLLFDNLWIARVTTSVYSDTIVIETPGKARWFLPQPLTYEKAGERFIVTAFPKIGPAATAEWSVCEGEENGKGPILIANGKNGG